MPKNEDGEFELILGNRQLLTVFFIVVVLFGVFFAMGYILGRNSGPLPPDVAAVHKTEKPLVVESPGRDASPTPPAAKSEPEPQPPPVEKPKPAETAKAEPEKAPPSKPKKPEPAKSKPEPAKPVAPASSEPSGTYLQLTATSQHEATLYVDVLKKKGFKAIAAEVPENHNLVRVLVGPLADGTVNQTKADLKAAGFPGDKSIKKTF